MRVYDPRDNTEKESNNVALIINQIFWEAAMETGVKLDNDFFRILIQNAGYYDEKVDINELKTS